MSNAVTGTASELLADWAINLEYTDLPASVEMASRIALVDTVAAIIAAVDTETVRAVRTAMSPYAGTGRSTAVGSPGRLPAMQAALINGTAAHALELDDGYTPGSYHPSVSVIPAALGLAQESGASFADVLTAITVGREIGCRVAAAGHPGTWKAGFHNTAIAGVFAAAAAAGRLRRLDATRFVNTLGVAASFASGLYEFVANGSEVKRAHAGKAAHDGVLAALLADAGLTGPETAFEGERGYFRAFARKTAPDFLADLGSDWTAGRTYIKPYPCCRHLHGPIDAALLLRSPERLGQIQPDDVEEVEVQSYAIAARHDDREPESKLAAQMSIPYTVARALTTGTVRLADFEPDALLDNAIRRLARGVSVHASDELDGRYPAERPALLRVKAGGQWHEELVSQPLGEPSNPISADALLTKVVDLVDPALGNGRGAALHHAIIVDGDLAGVFTAIADARTEASS